MEHSIEISHQPAPKQDCPKWLPRKFWDSNKGEARLEAMARSYAAMERKLGSQPPVQANVQADIQPDIQPAPCQCQTDCPDGPDGYEISDRSDIVFADPSINQRLHEAGFTHKQAQLVYDLAHEALEPLAAELAAHFYMEHQRERLSEKYGGSERWREVSRQLGAWGTSNLDAHTFEVLTSSYEGINMLYDMMARGEPGLMSGGENAGEPLNEKKLRQMMRDKRYWKDNDPAYVEMIRDGFRKLGG